MADERMEYEGFSYVEESEGITQYNLDRNGLTVLLVPLNMAPVVAFMITYKVGSRNESTGVTGATHFLEHLMFKGSERFNPASGTSIFNTLQRKGARVNATTWLDRTNYYELLPDDSLELAIEIEADRLRGANLDPADVQSERTVILNELDRGENEPLRKLYQTVWSTAFVAHPYRHPTIGWRSDVENISADQLRAFYDTYYWPNNATISIIGSFDPAPALEAVRKHFGPIPAGKEGLPEVHTVEPEQVGERRLTVRMAGEIGAVMVAFKAPQATDRRMPALSLLAAIMGSGKTGALYRRLVDAGLATSVSASESFHRDPSLFYVYAMLAPGVTHHAVEEAILEVIEPLKLDLVEPGTLERAKAQLHTETAFDRDGPFSMASSLNEAIAAGDWKLYTRIPRLVAETTAEAVREAAKTIFHRDRMTVGYFEPRSAEKGVDG